MKSISVILLTLLLAAPGFAQHAGGGHVGVVHGGVTGIHGHVAVGPGVWHGAGAAYPYRYPYYYRSGYYYYGYPYYYGYYGYPYYSPFYYGYPYYPAYGYPYYTYPYYYGYGYPYYAYPYVYMH